MRRTLPIFLLIAVLTSCQDTSEPIAPRTDGAASVQDAGVRAGGYIVVLQGGANPRAVAAIAGVEPELVYETALTGFSATLNDGQLRALRALGAVRYIEPDRVRQVSAQSVPTGIMRIYADENAAIAIDGVDKRVDADVAIIDTGIDFEHPDLDVRGGVNCTASIFFATCVSGGDDDHYHGTHVAGTVAALDNGIGVVGVAPGARLWAVKVLNKRGSGYSSWIVAGIDWVAANAGTIEVANMSLGGAGYSQAEYEAIQGAVNRGVAFAVAAGNEDDDANNYSPGGFGNVLSVSALADFNGLPGGGAAATCRSDVDDTLADFSNWGPEIDVAAPGVCILSTYPLEKGEYGTISGTSMASPHVAGALALLASSSNVTNAAGVENLYSQVVAAGNSGWVDDSGDGIKEPLLDVSTFAPTMTGTTPPPPPPGGITLAVTTRTLKSGRYADLAWSGATSASVDVYRNGVRVATTPNDDAYTDKVGKTVTSATYRVCEAGTSTCSNEVTVTW